jgi:hypothetical protein
MSDSIDHGFCRIHCAFAAEEVESGSSILCASQRRPFVDRAGYARQEVKSMVVHVTCPADEIDGGLQLPIAKPVLTLFPSLEPSSKKQRQRGPDVAPINTATMFAILTNYRETVALGTYGLKA